MGIYGRFENKENRSNFMQENKKRLTWYKIILALMFFAILYTLVNTVAFTFTMTTNRVGTMLLYRLIIIVASVVQFILLFRFSKIGLYILQIVQAVSVLMITGGLIIMYALQTGIMAELSPKPTPSTSMMLVVVYVLLAILVGMPSILTMIYFHKIRDLFE